jgi:hypothetical protein
MCASAERWRRMCAVGVAKAMPHIAARNLLSTIGSRAATSAFVCPKSKSPAYITSHTHVHFIIAHSTHRPPCPLTLPWYAQSCFPHPLHLKSGLQERSIVSRPQNALPFSHSAHANWRTKCAPHSVTRRPQMYSWHPAQRIPRPSLGMKSVWHTSHER